MLAFGVACKKSSSTSAEQAAPAPDQSAPPAAAPAAEQAAPAADQSVRIVETAPAAPPEPAPAPTRAVASGTAAGLRGAAEVHAAIQRKNYMGAVIALQSVKAGTKIEQRPEYNALLHEVRSMLVENMAKSPSAKQAYDTLRVMEAGR